jgi:hypothetical protein
MNRANKAAVSAIIQATKVFLALVATTSIVPLFLYIDIVVLDDGVSEYSLTEISQETLLLVSSFLFFFAAYRQPRLRGLFALIGGLLACMFVRELDFLFDMIFHGSWLFAAIPTAAASIAVAGFNRRTVLLPMAEFTKKQSCFLLVIGLLIVLTFSRLFGSGRLIWGPILGANYKVAFKAAVQEGLELFGYMFIFFGACLIPHAPNARLLP